MSREIEIRDWEQRGTKITERPPSERPPSERPVRFHRVVRPLMWLLSGNIITTIGMWVADGKAPAGAICYGAGIVTAIFFVPWLDNTTRTRE